MGSWSGDGGAAQRRRRWSGSGGAGAGATRASAGIKDAQDGVNAHQTSPAIDSESGAAGGNLTLETLEQRLLSVHRSIGHFRRDSQSSSSGSGAGETYVPWSYFSSAEAAQAAADAARATAAATPIDPSKFLKILLQVSVLTDTFKRRALVFETFMDEESVVTIDRSEWVQKLEALNDRLLRIYINVEKYGYATQKALDDDVLQQLVTAADAIAADTSTATRGNYAWWIKGSSIFQALVQIMNRNYGAADGAPAHALLRNTELGDDGQPSVSLTIKYPITDGDICHINLFSYLNDRYKWLAPGSTETVAPNSVAEKYIAQHLIARAKEIVMETFLDGYKKADNPAPGTAAARVNDVYDTILPGLNKLDEGPGPLSEVLAKIRARREFEDLHGVSILDVIQTVIDDLTSAQRGELSEGRAQVFGKIPAFRAMIQALGAFKVGLETQLSQDDRYTPNVIGIAGRALSVTGGSAKGLSKLGGPAASNGHNSRGKDEQEHDASAATASASAAAAAAASSQPVGGALDDLGSGQGHNLSGLSMLLGGSEGRGTDDGGDEEVHTSASPPAAATMRDG